MRMATATKSSVACGEAIEKRTREEGMKLIEQVRAIAAALRKISGEMERNGSPAALVFSVRNRADDLERAALEAEKGKRREA